MVVATNSTFHLGEWFVEPELGRLTRGDATVDLELKVMDVLLCLARCSGNLVTRQDLIDTVWATEYISDNTLTHAIAELRSALGDDAKSPSYIETIHRRGYRLLLDAFELEDIEPRASQEPSSFYVITDDRRVRLVGGDNLIGRIPWAAVTVDSLQVSRRHARIVIDEATAILEDLSSKNGTFLNGRRLDGAAPLADGDRIGLGKNVVVLQLVTAVTTDDGGTPTHPDFEG